MSRNNNRNSRISIGVFLLFLSIGITIGITSSVIDTFVIGEKHERQVIVIDAGHGGVDPGAVCNNALEKDINLPISLILRDMLVSTGFDVVMTRQDDIALNDVKYNRISQIKTSDLKNRLRIIDDNPNAIAVSIHQNKFTDENNSGAQMFYGSNNSLSKDLAKCLQDSFVKYLQSSNTRTIKPITKSVYIVHKAKNPVVLAECGFLSNRKEAAMLLDSEYQKKVAFTLYCGIVEFIKMKEV